MLDIQKSAEPRALLQYRLQPGASYDAIPTNVKDLIRNLLLEDQGYLCAYCMQRINVDTMKIEHWQPRSVFPNRELDWKNLLAVCKGNEGYPVTRQTCDTKKGDQTLNYNPAEVGHRVESRLRYSTSGKIVSDESVWDDQLNTTLNLNEVRLIENRRKLLEGVAETLNNRPGLRTTTELLRLIGKLRSRKNGEFSPFAGAAIFYLAKKIKPTV